MSHGVKHFLWRNGRPRWHPAAGLRAKGCKGKDLKDAGGQWLGLHDALHEAEKLNIAAGVQQPRTAIKLAEEKGYVYFLFTSTDKVKIGFSTTPGSRLKTLSTAMESHVRSMIVVEGSRADERDLHDAFFKERFKHEWFFASRRILNVALNAVISGKISTAAFTSP